MRLHDEPRLLFLYDVVCAMRKAGRRFAFWPSVCRTHHLPGQPFAASQFEPERLGKDCARRGASPALRSSQSVNAFLTLTDVTKW